MTRSVHQRLLRREPPRTIVTENGRIVGSRDADGKLRELPPCCEEPLSCEKPECWEKLVELPPGEAL